MEAKRREAVLYKDEKGNEPVKDWLEQLYDRQAKARINRRINRAEEGNFGDHRYLGDGVSELRIHHGQGYRLYYGLANNDEIILLLVGGDKSSQQENIITAKKYWKTFKGN